MDCRSGGNRWVVGGGQFCGWVGEDSVVVKEIGGGRSGDAGVLQVRAVAVDELLADDAAVNCGWRGEERVGRGEGLREAGLRVGFGVGGEEAVEFAGFGWGLKFVEFEEFVCGVEEDFVLDVLVGLGLVEDAVDPHFEVFCGGKGVDDGELFFFIGGLVVGVVGVGVVEGRVFPVGLFFGVLVGEVFFQGGFFGAIVVALGLVGVQFVLVVVGVGGVGVLQSPIFFAVECVEEAFSLLRGEFLLAGFGAWVLPRGDYAFYDGAAFFVEALRVRADGVEIEFFFGRGVFVAGVSEDKGFSGMGLFGGAGKEQGCRENSEAVIFWES